ncbi:hypothetical protein [Micromonospora sp. WMMD737]|uniref:hypothetical protein n=1 Tax=Micromonospora sp. WMMD737 TaxID=3404113 RepID=UPI003B96746D
MACRVWLDRAYLVGTVTDANGVWLSPTTARMPDGHLLELPAPCDHPAADCPPHAPTHEDANTGSR